MLILCFLALFVWASASMGLLVQRCAAVELCLWLFLLAARYMTNNVAASFFWPKLAGGGSVTPPPARLKYDVTLCVRKSLAKQAYGAQYSTEE